MPAPRAENLLTLAQAAAPVLSLAVNGDLYLLRLQAEEPGIDRHPTRLKCQGARSLDVLPPGAGNWPAAHEFILNMKETTVSR